MSTESAILPEHLETLSRLMFHGYATDFQNPVASSASTLSDLEYVSHLTEQGLANFLEAANKHHVLVRALQVLEKAAVAKANAEIVDWCQSSLAQERARIEHAVNFLARICAALQAGGCEVAVIKSLDHWPDLGSDLDLYTSADAETVCGIVAREFHAAQETRSWGDRLANKWNFQIPGLPELVEVHVRYLGQTGEHAALGHRVLQRSVTRSLNGHTFRVAAPEERVLISTLQRIYRHFYFRLCDMCDFAALLRRGQVDFAELRRGADLGGIWPGVTTFLSLVQEYASRYGVAVELPREVTDSVHSSELRVFLRGDFLRVPMLPAAELYGSQLFNAGRNGDMRAMFRLPLLPPLALTALLAYRVTGSDKGIW